MCAWYGEEEEIEEEVTVYDRLVAMDKRAREAQIEAYLEGCDYDEDNRYDEWRDNFEGGYSI